MDVPASAMLPLQRTAKKKERRRSLVRLTPLIDVVFILLVFFMLATSLLDWRAIELNAPGEAAESSSIEGALLVEVRADGFRLSGEALDVDTLARRVGERIRKKPNQRVIVKPAAGVVLQDTVALLDRLSAAGARELSLIRELGP